jgi:hypothetical protein
MIAYHVDADAEEEGGTKYTLGVILYIDFVSLVLKTSPLSLFLLFSLLFLYSSHLCHFSLDCLVHVKVNNNNNVSAWALSSAG